MYTLFLVLCTTLVILSPLALELYLNVYEHRAERRRLNLLAKTKSPGIAWATSRLH